jgi:hypothetical protein
MQTCDQMSGRTRHLSQGYTDGRLFFIFAIDIFFSKLTLR